MGVLVFNERAKVVAEAEATGSKDVKEVTSEAWEAALKEQGFKSKNPRISIKAGEFRVQSCIYIFLVLEFGGGTNERTKKETSRAHPSIPSVPCLPSSSLSPSIAHVHLSGRSFRHHGKPRQVGVARSKEREREREVVGGGWMRR